MSELDGIKAALRYLIQKDIDNEVKSSNDFYNRCMWRQGDKGDKDREDAKCKERVNIEKKYKILLDGLK